MSSLRRLLLILGGFLALATGLSWRTPLGAVEAQSGTAIPVDASLNRRAIDPRIYGVNWATTAQLQALNAPVHRWGGNSVTRYNWQLNADNRGSDWYFESIPDASSTAGAEADDFISQSFAGGAQPMMTIPLIGWTAKIGSGRTKLAGFSAAKYGAQQDCDWSWYPDACNGVKTDGTNVTGNDPNDANVASTPAIQKAWVDHLVSRWGGAAGGGLKYYIYDNEPSIWHSTHRDVRPTGVRMSELRDAIVSYGTAIRQSDPAAILAGPEEWGWMGYFWSGYDQQNMNATGCYSCTPDRDANGGVDFMPWLLDQLHQRELSSGVRLLDVLTLHYYPQGGEFGSDTSSAMQQRRNRSTRSLWDPNYVDETWINDRIRLIPRMRDWVNAYYPGIATGITEYSWGADAHINGATTQADVLGIFGREGLNLATRWVVPDTTTPTFKAFQMYRNYDGANSTFGDTSVSAAAPNPDNLSAFAAVRTSDGALTVMAINKVTTSALVSLSLASFTAGPKAQVWQLTSANSIQHLADVAVSAGSLTATLPAQSVTLFVVPAAGPALPALSIGDVTLSEGNSGTTSATFTVTLSAAAASTVSVDYATADGTAVAGSDYTASSGTLSFTAGQTSRTISVPVLGDTVIENDETFVVNLSGASGATLSRAQGSATIRNDDLPSLSVNDVRLNEGNSGTTNAVFTVTLSAAAPFPVTVNYATANGTATAGSDYAAQAGNLTFTAGQTSKTVSVPVQGDTTVEPDETFFVTLSSAAGAVIADAQGTGTILNDDSFTYYVSPSGIDTNACSQASPCRQIRRALALAAAGDTVLVADGSYLGFDVNGIDGTAARPITIRAQGTGAQVTTTTDRSDNRDTIFVTSSSYVVLDGLRASSANRAAVRVDQSAHVTIRNGAFGNNATWGIFSDFSDDLLLENNECYGSAAEHGIYVSNSGDRPTVRGNRLHDNAGAGVQLNADVSAGGDGIITGALIENNVIYNNGTAGGAGINLDGVQDSTVRNNLLYNNHATGIVNYQGDGASGPKGMEVSNNTIDQAADGRYALLFAGTVGPNRVRNNILYHPNSARGSITYGNASDVANVDSDYNVITRVTPDDGTTLYALPQWQALGHETHSITSTPASLFVNPAAADYHLAIASPAIDRGQSLTTVPQDIEGHARPLGAGWDLGAYESIGTAQPSLSINDVTVTEGNSGTTTATFTATLSPAATSTVTVNYATADGTATAGSDYVAKTGTLTFAAGVTTQPITVTVNGDTTVEPTETFFVNLSSPSGATLADAQGLGTITNDDTAPPPTLSINDVTLAEGNSGITTATFTVTLSAAATSTVTVNYATADGTAMAGSDYVAKTGTLTFAAGATTQTIAVSVNGDTVVEPDETFFVNLSSPSGATIADGQGVGTITNDDVATPPSGAQAVVWTSLVGVTASGNSLTKTAATGWGNAGAISTQQIASGDGYVEFTASETTTYRMLGLSNGNTNTDYTDIDFGIDEYGNGQIAAYEAGVLKGTFGTYVPGDVLRVAVVSGVVKYSKNGTVFYTSTKAPTYPLLVDTALYNTAATLNNAMIAAGTAGPSLSISDVSVLEGNSGTTTARFVVTLSAGSTSTVTVGYATADVTATAGSDYVAKSGTLSFPAGTTTQNVDVLVNGDTVVEPNETFVVNLTSPVGATIADAQGVGTITNDDVATPPSGAQAVVWTSVVGATASGNSLTKTAALGWNNAGAVSTQQIASGDGYVEFTASETTTYRMLGLSNGNTNTDYTDIDFGIDEYGNGQIAVYEAGVLKGTFVTYVPGDVLRVAVVGGVVKYSKNGVVFYTSTKAPLYPLLVDSALYNTAATLNNAMISSGSSGPTLSISDVSVVEGNSGTTTARFVVTLSATSTSTVTVGYATADVTATAGSDYVAKSGTLSFPAGTTTQNVDVLVNGDTVVEPNETFVVNLTNPVGATIADAQGVGTITNDDVGTPPSGAQAVVWTSVVGATASGNSLTKTAALGWNNAGAVSTQQIASGDGYVEFTASETTTYRMLGLSNGNTNTDYTDIDFGIDEYGNGQIAVYEAGVLKGAFGTYVPGDVLRVAVVSGVVKYSKNGVVFYTSTKTPVYPLLVDTALYNTAATLNNAMISSGVSTPPPAGAQAVVWTSVVGATASGNSLTKTAALGWNNAGAVSTQQIASGDGYVEFTASETTTYRMLGLSNGNTNTDYTDIDFGIDEYGNGQIAVYEAGVLKGTFVTYVPGDVLRVAVVSGVVKYSKNGTVFYTSPKTPVYPLLVDTSLYSTGATLNNAMILGP